jgi:hypothetical protein
MLLPENQKTKHENDLPPGMFTKMLATSLLVVMGVCLITLAIFSL